MIRIWFDKENFKDFEENNIDRVTCYSKDWTLVEDTILKNFCIEAKGDNIHWYTHLDNAWYYKFCDAELKWTTLVLTCTRND